MKYVAIQGDLDTYLYYFRLLLINLGAYYLFLKIGNNNNFKLKSITGVIFIFIITMIEMYVSYSINYMYGLITTILIFILLFDKYENNSASYTILSMGISNVIYFVSVMINGIPSVLFTAYNDRISFIFICIIYCFLLVHVIKIKRLRKGFSFLNNQNKNDFFDFIIINLSVIVLFAMVIIKNCDILIVNKMGIFAVIFSIIMFITIKKSFQVYYKQKLLMKQLEETNIEILNKENEIKKLEKENLELSKRSHSFAHKQKSLEYKVNQLIMKEETAEEIEIKNRVYELSKELFQEPVEELEQTGIAKIDDMFKFMQSECIKNKIDFNLKISGNIYYLINNLISEEALEILIADHLKDAIIAIKHTDNVNRSILVRLGKIEETYGLYIYDSGIEFEKETLENLGKKPSTTHKDEGGTGMGFMNTFDTLRNCKASLIINEIGKPSKENYTKVIMIKFDNKNEFKIISYKK